MTIARAAGLGAAAGCGFALAIAAVTAARAVYTITSSHRWYQLKHL